MDASAIVDRIAGDLSIGGQRISSAVELLDAGATIPFIARYRKEATAQLDEVQLERIAELNQ